MEKTGFKVICGAPTTLAVKGLIMRRICGDGSIDADVTALCNKVHILCRLYLRVSWITGFKSRSLFSLLRHTCHLRVFVVGNVVPLAFSRGTRSDRRCESAL